MKAIELIAVGKSASSVYEPIIQDYAKRLHWPLKIYEIESKYKQATQMREDENKRILERLNASRQAGNSFVIALDEKGKSLKSLEFSARLQALQNNGQNHLVLMIGGADGLSDEVKKSCDLLLSFGQQTWPHILVRVMVLEQIYRAQQILAGHPYHRE